MELVLCARTAAEVEEVARATGGRAVVADLATDAGAEAFAAAAGAVDLALICPGSAHRPALLEDAGRALLLGQLESNVVAPALAAAALLRHGAQHLLVLSSLATRRPPMPGAAPYTAAKAALEAIVRALAEESWPRARVNALCLGPVRTRLHEEAGTPREWLEQFASPDEAAALVLRAAALPGSGRIFDAEALPSDPGALGNPQLAAADAFGEPSQEAEPGRRPSPQVRAAVRATASSLHLYPRAAGELSARLAALHGVPVECIALSGGGATELLERCLRAFCAPGDEVLSPFPTFEVLSALCTREGLRHRPVPARRRPDGLFAAHEARGLQAAAGPRSRLVYVASPDNPTGAELPEDELVKLLSLALPVVLDEAWSLDTPAPGTLPRALRLRSLSKLYGLAALRVGYALGPPEQIALLRKLELPFPLGTPQLAAALAVLDEPERARRAALLLTRERSRVAQALRGFGCLVSDSLAPVLLVRDRRAGRLLFALTAAGLPVQEAHWDPTALVLGLGRRSENDRALNTVRRALSA